MDISVIIPTYKPQDYIWTCLDSLVNQTLSYDHFEVIIILNGCSEPWKSQIEDYIASNMSAMNVTFIQTDIPGVSNARNLGLDAIKGDYVFFIDDDDYMLGESISFKGSQEVYLVPAKYLGKNYEHQLSNPMPLKDIMVLSMK